MFWVARNELGEFTDQRVDTSLRSSFSTWNCKTFGTDQSAIRKRPPCQFLSKTSLVALAITLEHELEAIAADPCELNRSSIDASLHVLEL